MTRYRISNLMLILLQHLKKQWPKTLGEHSCDFSGMNSHEMSNLFDKHSTELRVWSVGFPQKKHIVRVRSAPIFRILPNSAGLANICMRYFRAKHYLFPFSDEPTRLISSCSKYPLLAVDKHNTENVRPAYHYHWTHVVKDSRGVCQCLLVIILITDALLHAAKFMLECCGLCIPDYRPTCSTDLFESSFSLYKS